MDEPEFPTVESMVGRTDLSPTRKSLVSDWLSLSPELRAMVPHASELIVVAMGGARHWSGMTEGERNIMSYSVVALFAEARRRAGS